MQALFGVDDKKTTKQIRQNSSVVVREIFLRCEKGGDMRYVDEVGRVPKIKIFGSKTF